jgi:hypothetical protein
MVWSRCLTTPMHTDHGGYEQNAIKVNCGGWWATLCDYVNIQIGGCNKWIIQIKYFNTSKTSSSNTQKLWS